MWKKIKRFFKWFVPNTGEAYGEMEGKEGGSQSSGLYGEKSRKVGVKATWKFK